ncbi:MAG TPA: thioredoxin domain-containing protein, partial [Eudoraea sp.]|nr:thioredoxin domain-containing protein [Eudoraea sp.]
MRPRLFIAILLLSLAPGACKNDKKLPGEHKFTNALIHETSPYLLQHAYNPVDWRPWSEEAFEAAKKEQKLVIVSVGYSSCHWCHVMEEETFEDVEVARLMNEKFISIKVDREERPDVDQIYMSAVQLMTGHGGWPLNAITLPNGKP